MKTLEKLFDRYEALCDENLTTKLSKTSLSHLTFNHYEYLFRIKEMNEPTLSELADNLKLSKPSVTNMVNKLLREDLVVKVQDVVDKRMFHVKLSELGEELSLIERKSFLKITSEMMRQLSDEEQQLMIKLLEKGMT